MNKFLGFLQNNFSYGKKLKETHPATLLGVVIGTIFGIIFAVSDASSRISYDFEKVMTWGIIASCLFVCGTFLFESLRLKLSFGIKLLICIAWAVVSIFWATTFYGVSHLLKVDDLIDATIGAERMTMFNTGLILLLICLGIYFGFRKGSEESFSVYLVKAFGKCFVAGIIYMVLNIGILLLALMIEELFNGDMEIIYMPLFAIILGLYFAPCVISAFVSENEEEPALIKLLIKYVMLILCLLAYVIIYIYILKIVILWQIPSNSIYAILTALFVISILVSYLCTAYEKNTVLQKIAYGMPIAFIPFLFLQSYAVIIRIVQHGFTPSRYFGVLFLVVEVVYIMVYLVGYFKKKNTNMSVIMLVMAGLILVGGVLPGTNGISFSKNMSILSLKSYIKNKGYEVSYDHYDFHSRNASAYSLLHEYLNEEKLSSIFNADERLILSNIKVNLAENKPTEDKVRYEREIKYINWDGSYKFDFDIEDYSNVRRFEIEDYSGNERGLNAPPKDTSALKIKINDDEENVVTIDCEQYLSDIVDNYAKIMSEENSTNDKVTQFWEYADDRRYIPLSDTTDLFLTNFYIVYDVDTKEIMSLSMDGMIFTK